MEEIVIRDENGDIKNEIKALNYMVIALTENNGIGTIFHGSSTFCGFVVAEATRVFNKSREEDFNNE